MSKYPFNKEEELKDVGTYPQIPGIYGMPSFPSRKFNTPITPKENVLRMCRKEKPLWLPNIANDINIIQPLVMPDALARWKGGVDWFGIEWEYEPQTNAAMVKPGTRRLSDITEWENELVFPDLNEIDWQKDYDDNYKDVLSPNRATMFVIVNGLFERTADLTSFEDTFCYLLEEPEALHAFYDKLVDWHLELFKIAKDIYGADIITFHDDMGTQRSSFFSPDTFKEIMLPHYKKLNNEAHKMGLYVNFHSCGSVANQVENFCEAGFDFWEGQDACNDKSTLMEQYGDKLGQVSMFMPEPTLSDDELIEAIKEKLNTVGKTGRYITWFSDLNPNRKINGDELIYTLSREMYSK
ncbi:hypothetical protein EAI30_12020 [Romboutsia ilealis]|uniref:Uroporphyrinogen decarboxylase (URO-D) domain-containing protein n=1 Tax=Romboutsia faecis TaxID=2764597 RepID=A0ABR7JS13_9FIRM|nr:uroporphyrinogen decarboxylase family protein [Romboutsia faecis]MBC5997707.1 hypothetical protein [Romboutsia faecis]MRN25345.1 hypothetical protein [Romboutsia ilealis]